MPSATGDHDKTTLDGNVVASSKSKSSRNPNDHVKIFEVAVFHFKEDQNEKSLANVEKALQVCHYCVRF